MSCLAIVFLFLQVTSRMDGPAKAVEAAFEKLYASETSGGWDKGAWEVLSNRGKSNLKFLLEQSRSSEVDRRWLSVAVLGEIRSEDTVDRLREMCTSDPSQLVRLEAIRNMPNFPGERTERLLEKILTKPIEADSLYAGAALKKLNPASGKRCIRSLLKGQQTVWNLRTNNFRLKLLDVLLKNNPGDRQFAVDLITKIRENHGRYAKGYMDRVNDRLNGKNVPDLGWP